MEVKEAVEVLSHERAKYNDREGLSYLKSVEYEKYREKIDKVIELLKRGEKFEEMWGWLDNIINSYYGTEYQREFTTQQIREHMGELEQKYLKEERK